MIQTPICSQTSLLYFAFALGCGQRLKGQGGERPSPAPCSALQLLSGAPISADPQVQQHNTHAISRALPFPESLVSKAFLCGQEKCYKNTRCERSRLVCSHLSVPRSLRGLQGVGGKRWKESSERLLGMGAAWEVLSLQIFPFSLFIFNAPHQLFQHCAVPLASWRLRYFVVQHSACSKS